MSTAALQRSNMHPQENYTEDDLYTYITEEYNDDDNEEEQTGSKVVNNFNDFDVLDLIEDDEEDFERWMEEEKKKEKQQQKKKKRSSKNMDKKTTKPSDKKKGKRTNAHIKRSKTKTSIDTKKQQKQQKQTKQRHSAKLPVKKHADANKKKMQSIKPVAKKKVRVSLPPKEHKKREKIKLDRSASSKVIQESKASKPSSKKKSKRSKSRFLISETNDKNQENVNKTNGSKQKTLKLHNKSKSCKIASATTQSLARSKSNKVNALKTSTKSSNNEQKKQLSFKEPPKENYIKGVSFKEPPKVSQQNHMHESYALRKQRRKTKKLIISKPVDKNNEQQEEEEANTEDEDSGSYEEEDDDDEEEEEEEKKDFHRNASEPIIERVESSSNITPSLVASSSNFKVKEEEMKQLYKEYDELKRSQWTLSSELQVYSKSERSWMKAKVIEVIQNGYYFDDGEWLKVLYFDSEKNELTKSLPRKDRYFRHNVPHFTHLKKGKTRKTVKRFMERNANIKPKERFKSFFIGQKCEFWDRKNERKRWCSVVLLYEDKNASYVGVRYWNDEHMEYKETLHKGFDWLRATIPRKVGPVMVQKWKYLSHRVKQVPQLIEARNDHLNAMADFYSRYEISDYKEIPDAVCMLIQSQNIKLFPILLLDIDNILIPNRFIEFMQREYDNSSMSKMFQNLDDLCNPKKRKGKGKRKQYTYLRRKMYSVMRKLNALLDAFRGKIAVLYEDDWDHFVCDIPDSAGGVVWRRMFKRFISQRNQNDEFGFYSAKRVLQNELEKGEFEKSEMNLNKARELAMIRFFRSKLMEMEYRRLKDETYYIPVVLALSDPQKHEFHSAACNAAQEVFSTYYRVICYQLDTERLADVDTQQGSSQANDTLRKLFHQNRHIEKTFVKCTKHPFMDVFIDHDEDFYKLFEKHSWHKLFKDYAQNGPNHAIEYIKISP